MYDYYDSQINPIIGAQENSLYMAKIKIVAGDNSSINTNYMDVNIKQLEKIKEILKETL